VSLGIFSVATDGTMCPGVYSDSRNEYQEDPGGKDGRTTLIVPKVVKNPESLSFRIPKGLFRPVAGNLYLYLSCGVQNDYRYITIRIFRRDFGTKQ
jgi:hypothetical protein